MTTKNDRITDLEDAVRGIRSDLSKVIRVVEGHKRMQHDQAERVAAVRAKSDRTDCFEPRDIIHVQFIARSVRHGGERLSTKKFDALQPLLERVRVGDKVRIRTKYGIRTAIVVATGGQYAGEGLRRVDFTWDGPLTRVQPIGGGCDGE